MNEAETRAEISVKKHFIDPLSLIADHSSNDK